METHEISDLQTWLQTGGLAAVVAVLFGILYRFVLRLLDLQKTTTEVIDNNTAAVRSIEKVGTEHVNELRNLDRELRSRPCILPARQQGEPP